MSPKRIKTKGTLIWDENLNALLKSVPKETGYRIITPKLSEKGIGLQDKQLIEKYARTYPLVTHDHTIYNDKAAITMCAGIVDLQDVGPLYISKFKVIFKDFLQNTKFKELKKHIHIVTMKGITKNKLR